MFSFNLGRFALIAGGLGVVLASPPASADDVADFFAQKKTVVLLAGTRAGGSYGLYGGIIAKYMSQHIPGKPKIVMNYMPGAGGGKAANYLFGVAPKDGSWMLSTHAIPLIEKLRGGKGVRFKSAEFIWLGAFSQIAQLMAVWHTAPATTLDAMKKKELIIGAFAKSHPTFQWPALLNNTIGTKYKLIVGYRGGATNNRAMEQGETHGWTPSWGNLNGTKPDWLRDKKVRIVAQFGLDKVPELPNVPSLKELVPANQRDIVDFLTAATPVSRSIALPPGVPAERVAALRAAFEKTMKDPGFLAEIKKRNLTVMPRSAAQVTALVNKIVNASPELVERVKKAVSGDSAKRMKK